VAYRSMPRPVRVRGPERLGKDGACVRYAEEVMRHDEPRSKVAESTTCQAADSGTGKCKTAMCNVWIGGKDYCSKCAETAELLIDGTCVARTDELAKKCTTNTKGACLSCGDGYFLYSNGCYAIGGTPGSNICADPTPSEGSSDTAGKCATCAPGYFKNPADVAAGTPPCIACNDTTGFTDSTNTYKGVLNCEVCSPPATSPEARTDSVAVCTKCGNSKYLKTDGTCGEASECTGTTFPKADNNAGNKCVSCSDNNNGGIADCQTCSNAENTLKCSACNNNKKPNTAKTACVPCNIEGCTSCDKENVCATCDSGKYLTPTSQCVDSCEKLGGYYADNKVCKPCDPSCASCSTAGADKCLSCPAGKALKYTDETKVDQGGSCVDECRASTGGCADCGAAIRGPRYCSRCSDTNQAPLDGNCAANTMRTKFCTNASNGACTQCTNNYFLFTNCLLSWLLCSQ
ncbi:Variant-specific surface protein, partial [Giardia duodenalis]